MPKSDIDTKLVKKLREETEVSVMRCKSALEEADGDYDEALEILEEEAQKIAEEKSEREIKEGVVESYIHNNEVGALLELGCETDFVARNEEFQELASEIAMQIASMEPEDVDDLLDQEYIKDPEQKIEDLIQDAISKLGENIEVRRFARYDISS